MERLHTYAHRLSGLIRLAILVVTCLLAVPSESRAQVPDCQPGTPDWASAIQWIKSATKSELDAQAKKHLVTALCFGRQVEYLRESAPAAYERSVESFKLAIEENDPVAMFFYANTYFNYNVRGRWNPKTNSTIQASASEMPAIHQFANDLFERSAKLGFLPSAFQACIRIEDVKRAIPRCEQAEQQAVGSMKQQAAAKLAELRKAAGPNPNNMSTAAAVAGASARGPSNDRRAVFGLMVGERLPNGIPECVKGEGPKDKDPYCLSAESSGRNSGLLLQDRAQLYVQAGASPLALLINESVFDTGLLFAIPLLGNVNLVEMWIAKDQTILGIHLRTKVAATQSVAKMLAGKYGSPSRTSSTKWTDGQGSTVGNTPNYFWQNELLIVEYFSTNEAIGGARGVMGTVDVWQADFLSRVIRLKKANAPPPRKPM